MRATVVYEGVVGRAENRAMVSLLRLQLRRVETVPDLDWGRAALVDTQPRSGNNSCPRGARPLVVIDHHPRAQDDRGRLGGRAPGVRRHGDDPRRVPRPLGAPGAGLARHGLAYGISSETRDLGRGAGERDLDAYLRLYPRVRKRILAQIEHPRLPRSYFALLDRALHRAFSYRNVIGSRLGPVDAPDSVAEIADFLLAHERMGWSVATGTHGGQLHLSLRTTRGRGRA